MTLTPMLRHYVEVKSEYPDAILLYRMGDFYELFFEDAVEAAPILDVQLTARQKGTPSEAPMCGVPHHSIEGYIGKLIRAGRKVAVCDQVEDPAEAKGLVRREVTRVLTPGTVSEPELLEGGQESLLAGLFWDGDVGAGAFLDVSTGSFWVRRWRDAEEAWEDLALASPQEVLVLGGAPPELVLRRLETSQMCISRLDASVVERGAPAQRGLEAALGGIRLRGLGLDEAEPAVVAAWGTLRYATDAARVELSHVRDLELREPSAAVTLDETTARNLELFRSLRDGGRKGTLLDVLDRTVTGPGARSLRRWLAYPLRDLTAIRARHEAVEELVSASAARRALQEDLERVGDLERLASRAVLGRLSPREAGGLREALDVVPTLLGTLAERHAVLLAGHATSDPLPELCARLTECIVDEPPATLGGPPTIREGVSDELDRVRSLAQDGKGHLARIEAREREATGISSLKVRFNKVFGYFIEVTKANRDAVPEHYQRKQTLTNAERFVTDELKELEVQILDAEASLGALEAEIFAGLVQEVAIEAVRLQRLSRALAEVDSLASFAEVADRRGYCRPQMVDEGQGAEILEGRHPVVEATRSEEFVPNDATFDASQQIVVLTGPNMGGKSTYLRQVALTVLMAHAGSFVPATSATLSVVDRIFTRVGASDDLARGESTFMVEMIETANILRYATDSSLVVLDEVGRGTATFDGLSLAWAIVEYLHEQCGAMTMFATHYHELTELASLLPRVSNRTMTVREWDERIVFLHRVVPGSADKSYGIQVARLAGLPKAVTDRASEVLANLEKAEYDPSGKPRIAEGEGAPDVESSQMALFARTEDVVAQLLREVDLDRMTPLAALNFLQTVKDRLG